MLYIFYLVMINLTKLNKRPQQEIRTLGKPKVSRQSSQSFRTPSSSAQVSRIVVGTPFEIRIPTKEINYLLEEVQNLKSKCKHLEDSITPEQKPHLSELTASMKKIQDNVNISAYTDPFFDQDFSIQEQVSYRSDQKVLQRQLSFKSYQGLLQKLNSSEQKVCFLEKKNEKLEEALNQKQNIERNLKIENQILKERIKLLFEKSDKNLPQTTQISEQNQA